MKQFKNILLVIDPYSETHATINRAILLAKANQAQLTIIDVLGELPPTARTLLTALKLQEITIEDGLAQLARLSEIVKQQGIEVNDTKMLKGVAFIEIIKTVLQKDCDLVIKTAQGKEYEHLFSSTDKHLMRKCPCPVWIIKPEKHKRYQRVLAALDPDPADEHQSALNNTIMDLATTLATSEPSELHVVSTWELYGENTLRESVFIKMPQNDIDALIKELEQRYQNWLESFLERYDTAKPHVHLLKAKPAAAIPALAQQHAVELIVMGSVGRTGLPGMFMGNTAEAILNQVNCAVLTVKPKGFVTPVTLE
ncbi:MAG: universal stress protein [Pseudomonadota bacterium]|nr:universal stress protein [Pseudomonadota bacterium]